MIISESCYMLFCDSFLLLSYVVDVPGWPACRAWSLLFFSTRDLQGLIADLWHEAANLVTEGSRGHVFEYMTGGQVTLGKGMDGLVTTLQSSR